MPTLTIEVTDNLYAELIRAVAERDIPMQAFLHLAIAEEIDREKNRQQAEQCYAEYVRTGKVSTLDEIEEHFDKRIAELSRKTGTQGV